MTIFEILRDDHHRLRLLLENLIEATSHSIEPHNEHPSTKTARKHLGDLSMALVAHARAEDLVFYARLRFIPHRDGLADEQVEMHRHIESILETLRSMDVDDDAWDETLSLLKNELESHLAEEEATIFPILQLALEGDEAERLGRDFEIARDDFLEHELPRTKKAPLMAPSPRPHSR